MSKRILLIDDEPEVRPTLTDRLHDEGYVVETAAHGEEGLARATSERFDLVVLRRRGAASPPALAQTYRFGPMEVDFRRAELRRAGRLVGLSAKEFRLLRYFILHRGATLSRDELLDGVWGYDAMPATRTVDTHVAWLRGKIEPNRRRPQFILTIHGLGYKFVG